MVSCCVKWCGKQSSTSNYKKDGITFHRFPKSPDLKNQWMDATYRGDSWFPSNTSAICSRHFTTDNFHTTKQRRRLMNFAVPTLYLPVLAPIPSGISIDHAITDPQKPKPLDFGAGASSKQVCDPALVHDIKPEVTVPAPAALGNDVGAGTPTTLVNGCTLQDSTSTASQQQTPSRKRKLYQNSDPDTPSAYDTPVEKRLCRRIIELKSVVKEKNVKIRKLNDSNRRLKRQIISLTTHLELKKKELITPDTGLMLDPLGVKVEAWVDTDTIETGVQGHLREV